MVAMKELSTEMSLLTCLPTCVSPTITYQLLISAAGAVIRWWHVIGQRLYRHNKSPLQQVPTNPSYKQLIVCFVYFQVSWSFLRKKLDRRSTFPDVLQRYYLFPTGSVIIENVVNSKNNKLRVAITIYCLMA